MLTAAYLAATCPKLIAPSMNTHMLEAPATKRNLKTLQDDGVVIASPDEGLLACGVTGKGKLVDYDTLRVMMDYTMSKHPLAGKNILVTAGPTQESMDPVRFISNHSTGKMGYAIAKAAFILGADVHLLSGPVALKQPPLISFERFTSAMELYKIMQKESPFFDYIIMSAAIGDYRSDHIESEKIKKKDDSLTITFKKNPDILAYLGAHKEEHQVICGFAMETQDLLKNAKEKLIKKNADMIVANSLKTKGAGFATNTNVATLITKDKVEPLELMSKEELGFLILKKCKELEEASC
jgi:phosphopantothenoylcysteine decarboxylase/phosphopantothenate--cysteine ligase